MDKFQVKKIENCFKDSQTYEYKINMEIDEGFLDKLKNLGKVEIKNFRRPIFMIDCENKNKIKGVIKSKIIKVSYPDDIWQIRKEEFERYLDEIL
ncbi:hypothetical protein [Terrisporobacter sp.]